MENAFAFFDDEIDRQNSTSRIFIEPPNEEIESCDESEDQFAAVICSTNCEVILRNGKRFNTGGSGNTQKVPQKIRNNVSNNKQDQRSTTSNEKGQTGTGGPKRLSIRSDGGKPDKKSKCWLGTLIKVAKILSKNVCFVRVCGR